MDTIRPIRESELDELIDLLCAVHNPEGHERYRGYMEGDPTWCPSQTPVIVVEGRIVSTLRIWDRWVHLGATPRPHGRHRRRHHASRLPATRHSDAGSWIMRPSTCATMATI